MQIIAQLQDLLKQAKTDRSHHYVAKCCRDAIAEIARLQADLASANFAAAGFKQKAEEYRKELADYKGMLHDKGP